MSFSQVTLLEIDLKASEPMTQKNPNHTNINPVTKITKKSHKTLKLGVPNIETATVLAMSEHDKDV